MQENSQMPGGMSYINTGEPQPKPPPRLETGVLGWMRENLFSSIGNTLLTIVGLLLSVYTVFNITHWIVAEGNWLAIIANLRQFMVGSFPPQYMWRIQLVTVFSTFVLGMAVAIWIRQIARIMFVTVVAIIAIVLLLPPITKLLIPLPDYYDLAGQGTIQTGSATEVALSQFAFIGQANEQVSVRLADSEIASEEILADLNGYASVAANTLRNAAANRLTLIAQRDELERRLQEHRERIFSGGIPLLTEAQVAAFNATLDAMVIPAPIIENYAVNSIDVQVSVTNAATGELLGEPIVLTSGEDVATFTLPADGWYILEKVDNNPVEVEDTGEETPTPAVPATNSQDIRNVSGIAPSTQGNTDTATADAIGGTVALLDIQGIYPVLQASVYDVQQERFVASFTRATDFFRISQPVPRDDTNTALPYIVINSNQYRGERSWADYIRAYVTPFFDSIKFSVTIVLVVGMLGYFTAANIKRLTRNAGNKVWTSFDSLQVWVAVLVMLTLLMGPVNIQLPFISFELASSALKVVAVVLLAVYIVGLLTMRANANTATSLGSTGFILIPIVMWIYINGFYFTTAVALGGVVALALQCLAVYRLGQRNGWNGWLPRKGAVDGSMIIVIASLVSYIALVLMMNRINGGGWAGWIVWLGFIPLLISALLGTSLSTPDALTDSPPRAVLIPFFIAGLIIAVIFFSGVGLQPATTSWLFEPTNPNTWSGLLLTMILTVYGVIISFPIGIGLALGRRSDLPLIKYLCIGYIELIRGIPFITVLFFMNLMIPLIDPRLAAVPNGFRAIVATIAFSAAYMAENVRGGLQSLPPGQTEAAKALGLNTWQTTLLITLPQALRAVIPALVGQFIGLFKDTSLVTIIGLIDLTGVVKSMVVQPEFPDTQLEGLVFVSVIYFVVSYVLAYISRLLEASGSGATRRMT
jgi:His/Glu/Gln/Arg/opine family amino acid ABC transporter permease subunit